MSWSFAFVAKNKDVAKARLAAVVAPTEIVVFCQSAVEALPDDGRAISVESNGHRKDSAGSYEVSTASVTVKPITIEE